MNSLFDSILDTLIPPSSDGRMPGAGSIGIGEAVREQTTAAAEVVNAGLAAAEAKGFSELDESARVAALREIEASIPAFIPTVFVPTCTAYYQHPQVRIGLALPAGPPHPKGYELEPGDLEALERVRKRGRLYRQA